MHGKLGVSEKDLIPTPLSCSVKMGILGDNEESGYHSSYEL